jgi:hypothetical protein
MPVEGRGLSLKETQEATKTEGLVMNLTTPESVQKLQTGVARQSEGIAQLSFLRAVRQGVSKGCSGLRLRMLQSQWRGSRSGLSRTSSRTEESDGWTNWRKS